MTAEEVFWIIILVLVLYIPVITLISFVWLFLA